MRSRICAVSQTRLSLSWACIRRIGQPCAMGRIRRYAPMSAKPSAEHHQHLRPSPGRITAITDGIDAIPLWSGRLSNRLFGGFSTPHWRWSLLPFAGRSRPCHRLPWRSRRRRHAAWPSNRVAYERPASRPGRTPEPRPAQGGRSAVSPVQRFPGRPPRQRSAIGSWQPCAFTRGLGSTPAAVTARAVHPGLRGCRGLAGAWRRSSCRSPRPSLAEQGRRSVLIAARRACRGRP
jgi:hypothetical protein